MSKSRPELYQFLDDLTERLIHIGRDQLAYDIRGQYARGVDVDTFCIITLLAEELDQSEQLELQLVA